MAKQPIAPAPLALTLAFLCACAAPDKHTGFTTSDSATIRIANNDTPVERLQPIITSDSARVVTIGVTSGEDPYMFGHVADATRLESGHIVVADGQTTQLRIFDSTGKHVVTYGRKGQGPGEFLTISSVVASGGDTVLAWDAHVFRFSTFTVSGGFVSEGAARRKPLSDLLIKDFYYEQMYPVADGSLIVEVTPRDEAKQEQDRPPAGVYYRPRSLLVWVSHEFQAYRRLGEHFGIEQISTMVGGRQEYFVPRGGRWPMQSVGGTPPRICIDAAAGAQVNCFDQDGHTTFIRWLSQPVPLPESEFEKWRNEELDRAGRGERYSRSELDAALANIPPHKELPPVTAVHVDKLGFVWTAGPDLPRDSLGNARFRIFDRQGKLIGYASTRAIIITEIGEDYVLGVSRNIDGAEIVVMRALKRFPPP